MNQDKKRLYTTLLLSILVSFTTGAQTKDDNIVIGDKTVVYSYGNEGNGKYSITEQSSTDYICIGDVKTIPISIFYDNNSEITKLKVQGIKTEKPRYEMYQGENEFYGDSKVCYFSLPFARKDQTARVSYTKRYNDIQRFWSAYLNDAQYTQNGSVIFEIPDKIKVDLVEQNFGENITKTIERDDKNKLTRYIYRLKKQGKFSKEENMPDYSEIYPLLIVVHKEIYTDEGIINLFTNFDDAYAWAAEYVKMVHNDPEIIKKKANEITNGCIDDESKIKALLTWVQKNIRYLVNTYEIAGYKPDDAQEVLRKKYGDCKGKSNLLKALLMAEGFDARLAWVGVEGRGIDPDIPLPTADHMICVLNWNNKSYFLEPTAQYLPFGLLYEGIQGKTIMVENGEKYLLEQTPSLSPKVNTDSLYAEYTINNDVLEGNVFMQYRGQAKWSILNTLMMSGDQNKLKELEKVYKNDRAKDEMKDIVLGEIDEQSDNFDAKWTVTRQADILRSGNEIYINLNSYADFATLSIDTATRKFDYVLPYKLHLVREEKLHIPTGYHVKELPEDLKIESKGHYSFGASYSIVDNDVRYKKVLTIYETRISKSMFDQWNKDIDQLKKSYLNPIIITKE